MNNYCSRCKKELQLNYDTNRVVYGPYIFCDDCDESFNNWIKEK